MAKWRKSAPDLLQGWVDAMKKAGQGAKAEEVAKFWKSKM